jgi:hypothetical protein
MMHFEIKREDGGGYLGGKLHRELWDRGGLEEEITIGGHMRERERESFSGEEKKRERKKKGVCGHRNGIQRGSPVLLAP